MDLSNENVIHIKRNNQEFLKFRKLLKYEDVITHCYSIGIYKDYRTSRANNQKLPEEVYKKNLSNYKNLCEENGLNYKNIVKARQAHTDIIENIKYHNSKELITTENFSDGLITNKNNVILATTNADCILLLFFDPKKKVIANIHSGWKGTVKRISVKTIRKMVQQFGCNPRDIIVCICPSIRQCHFEVDKDVYDIFSEKFKDLGDQTKFIEEKMINGI